MKAYVNPQSGIGWAGENALDGSDPNREIRTIRDEALYAQDFYWVDETESLTGPYASKEDADKALSDYVLHFL